jgi:hypothetical protein
MRSGLAFALPVHYWIDEAGIVRDWAVGELHPEMLQWGLEVIVASPP